VSRALVETYISGLALAEVAIVGAGRRCRIHTDGDGDLAPGEPVAHRYFFKPSHVDLLLSTIGPEGMSGRPAAALAELVVQAAASIGASFRTPGELQAEAERQVAEITARIRMANQQGGLKQINAQYKRYRQAQIARAEKALPYSAFIEPFIMTMVRNMAATGRMI
jgi:hypothetical protein